jgi:magnesium transporter
MIEAFSYRGDQVEVITDPADVSEVVGKGGLVWMDLIDPTDTDFRRVQEEFSLHPLAIEDATNHHQRPKLEKYPTHAFVVAYSKELAEVDIFVGRDWVVTVRERDAKFFDLEGTRARFERTRGEDCSSGFLLYTILDEIVDGYFETLETAEEELEETEELIFGHEKVKAGDVQAQMLRLRREILMFRRRVVPLREVVSALLRKEVDWLDDATLLNLQDVFDHVLRTIDQIDTHRELIGNAVDAHLATISNQVNQVMKQMTAGGSIVLGATLIAGIYGMNFHNIPELSWPYGYPYALGLMVVMSGLLFWYFRRKDWL